MEIEIPAQIFFGRHTDEAVNGKNPNRRSNAAVSTWILGLILICASAARAQSWGETSSTTSKEKSDSITVKAIGNDPRQKKPITVTLKGEK